MKYKIGKSKIQGKGIICTKPIKDGEQIALVFEKVNTTGNDEKDWQMLKMGAYVNHTWNPNSRLNREGNNYYLQAIKNINKNEEIASNYNDSPDFVSKANPMWD